MSTPRLQKKLIRLVNQERDLIECIAQSPPMLRGSFSRVHTRCGKATCWCAASVQGHPHTRITWSEEGKMITRKVSPDEVEKVIEWTANYRTYRALRRRLRTLQGHIADTLDQLERSITERTHKPLAYLADRSNLPTTSRSKRQKATKKGRSSM